MFLIAGAAITAKGKPIRSEETASEASTGRTNASPWADFVEKDFPFYSSVLDARGLGDDWLQGSLTPRGIILNLGSHCWACFDPDLLRMSAVWTGEGVSPVSMSQVSYHHPGAKGHEGQEHLPRIVGTPWLVNGVYPGWQTGETWSPTDPRPAGPDPKEVGRGPLDPGLGRFGALRQTRSGLCLEYKVAGNSVSERVAAREVDGRPMVQRSFRFESVSRPLTLVVGQHALDAAEPVKISLGANQDERQVPVRISTDAQGVTTVRVAVSRSPVEFRVAIGTGKSPQPWIVPHDSASPPGARWPEAVVTSGKLAPDGGAFVVDRIGLPLANPWHRNVRLADIAFLKDGRAAAVTFDGDVWLISGLSNDLRQVTWKRFTSGLAEPLAICTRDNELFVFDRNGIWRLRDTDHNGEADVHELFSNAFAQTAETREFPTGLRAAPDGSLILSKGGQQSSPTGGEVLRISPDGNSARVLGWGLRQPFLGVNPRTGLVTASDQEGNYVPSTPLHVIRDGQFYGFLSKSMPKEKYPAPVADALTWIPHTVNASAVGQVWLYGAKMGPLNDAFVSLGYFRPEVFLVLLNHRSAELQAAVVSLTHDFEFAPLNGALNPADGQLYVAGFQIWGTVAPQVSGLARVRYTGAPSTLPCEVAPMEQGVLLRFNVPLFAATATNLANFSAERWNYRRTAEYGSPHFKLDGAPGQETMIPSSAYLSRDGRCIFVGLPDMQRVMQMQVGWRLATEPGVNFEQNAYFTIHALPRFDPVAEGFAPLTVDLTRRSAPANVAPAPVTVAEGQRLATVLACVACHSADGSTAGKVGPTWKGLFGGEVVLTDGRKILANEDYVRESILEPSAKIVRGFDKSDAGMPSYQGAVTEPQIQALILYIKSLR